MRWREQISYSLYISLSERAFPYMCGFLTAVNVSYFPVVVCTFVFFFKGIQELGEKIRTFLAGPSGYYSQRLGVAFGWIEAVLLYEIFSPSPRRVFIRYSRAHHVSIVSADYANARWA